MSDGLTLHILVWGCFIVHEKTAQIERLGKAMHAETFSTPPCYFPKPFLLFDCLLWS